MTDYLTYLYLLSPLHTGGSSQEGNLVGIAREVHTDFPYLPSSSLRGKIRSECDRLAKNGTAKEKEVDTLFGCKLKDGKQPTEGTIWIGDASLLFFPIASLSHQYIWITCPLWLSRWNRWRQDERMEDLIGQWRSLLDEEGEGGKKAISPLDQRIYLQGAILNRDHIKTIPKDAVCWEAFESLPDGNGILNLKQKLVVVSDFDCGALVELGLQREVRIALKDGSKTAADGSFRSEEAIPSESILFFPWGSKPAYDSAIPKNTFEQLRQILNSRLQFGGLEGLGRGWSEATTVPV
ncbi:MAG: type III-B CRISPR module RAMP protein Cmr4 [Oscillatoria sp. SIO1A7]|nr:type III-B CRISPR module RAMP protein Cmr4 [Oscillatoria sp. SIO1A7]